MATRLTQLSRSVSGRRIVVTGSASGIGRATAELFADEGARVALVDRDEARLAAAVQRIVEAHGAGSAVPVVADLALPGAPRRAIDAARAALGGIDVLVNDAGVSMVSSVFQDDAAFDEAWETTMAVNVGAAARTVRAAVDDLRAAEGGGRVVNIASTEAVVATAGIAAYSASKAALAGLTRSLASELGRFGVTVNAVCPGPVNTAMTAVIDDEAKQVYAKRRVALRRYAEPEEIAHMILSLCLPAASFVTGATILVDGGLTIRH